MIIVNNMDRPFSFRGKGGAHSFTIPSGGIKTLSKEEESEFKANKTTKILIDKGLLRTGKPKGEVEVVDTVKQTQLSVGDVEKTNPLLAENNAQAATISTEIKGVQLAELPELPNE